MDRKLETLRNEWESAEAQVQRLAADEAELQTRATNATAQHNRADIAQAIAHAEKMYEQAQDKFAAGQTTTHAVANAREALEEARRLADEPEVTRAAISRRAGAKCEAMREARRAANQAAVRYWQAVYEVHLAHLQKVGRTLVLQTLQIASRVPYKATPDLSELFSISPESFYLGQQIESQRQAVETRYGLSSPNKASTTA